MLLTQNNFGSLFKYFMDYINEYEHFHWSSLCDNVNVKIIIRIIVRY